MWDIFVPLLCEDMYLQIVPGAMNFYFRKGLGIYGTIFSTNINPKNLVRRKRECGIMVTLYVELSKSFQTELYITSVRPFLSLLTLRSSTRGYGWKCTSGTLLITGWQAPPWSIVLTLWGNVRCKKANQHVLIVILTMELWCPQPTNTIVWVW
jgi:hypothetical protein